MPSGAPREAAQKKEIRRDAQDDEETNSADSSGTDERRYLRTAGYHRGARRDGAERAKPETDRYLYENLVSNVESQIEHWARKAAREPNPETTQTLRTKAEGLGYALRLLAAFEPDPASRDDRCRDSLRR